LAYASGWSSLRLAFSLRICGHAGQFWKSGSYSAGASGFTVANRSISHKLAPGSAFNRDLVQKGPVRAPGLILDTNETATHAEGRPKRRVLIFCGVHSTDNRRWRVQAAGESAENVGKHRAFIGNVFDVTKGCDKSGCLPLYRNLPFLVFDCPSKIH